MSRRHAIINMNNILTYVPWRSRCHVCITHNHTDLNAISTPHTTMSSWIIFCGFSYLPDPEPHTKTTSCGLRQPLENPEPHKSYGVQTSTLRTVITRSHREGPISILYPKYKSSSVPAGYTGHSPYSIPPRRTYWYPLSEV